MPLEISVEKRCLTEMRRRNVEALKMGLDGLPDRLCLWGHGLHFWIEFKKPLTGRLRAMQVVWKKYLEASYEHVYVIDSFEELVKVLDLWENDYGPATCHRP